MFEGYIDGVSGTDLLGWAWNATRSEPVLLEVVVGTDRLGTAQANLFREDLKQAGKGQGRHGFLFAIPDSLPAGSHALIVRNAETGQPLVGSPFLFHKEAPPPPLEMKGDVEGYIDAISDGALAGWAWNPGVDAPVALEVLLDKASVGTIEANIYRQDLERAGKRRGYHGFSFPLPKDLGEGPHSFVVRCRDTEQLLVGCPFEFVHSRGKNHAGDAARPAVVARPQLGRLDLTRFSSTNLPTRVVQGICTRFLAAGLIDELATYVAGMSANGRPSLGEKFDAVVACAKSPGSDVNGLSSLLTDEEAMAAAAYFDRSGRPQDADRIRAGRATAY